MMTETTKHVLAACDGQGQPIAYLSSAKNWTNSLNEAVHFTSQHEATDFLHAHPHERNPGPVRSFCLTAEKKLVSKSDLSQEKLEVARLYTGIYG